MTYQQKKQLFGGTLPNLKGFDYYKGGIFNLTDPKSSKKGSQPAILSHLLTGVTDMDKIGLLQ